MPAEPPSHLSEEARAYLSDPPPPLVGVNATDPVVVAATRADLHPMWEAEAESLTGPWVMRHEEIAGVRVVRFAADEAALDDLDVHVHLHGGAYFVGSPMTSTTLSVPVAQRTGRCVVSVYYRLAPEHRCPAAIDDAVSVIRALAERGRVIGLFGESAGGGLSLASAVALRDGGHPLPERIGLVSPWVDLTCSGDTYRTLAPVDPCFPDPADPPNWASAYAGESPDDPAASPLFARHEGLPPTLIQVGGREIVLSDSLRLAGSLSQAGVDSTLDVWDGLWHVWQMVPGVPEAELALDELSEFLEGAS